MVEVKRIDSPEDPNRCQGITRLGQCQQVKMEHSSYCATHGGTHGEKAHVQQSKDMYRLAKYNTRLRELSNHDGVKSLRDEIGILRILMEEKLNQCGDPLDLMTNAPIISDLAVKIEKLVSSCQKVEGLTGNLLDKQAILQFADQVISIIGDEFDDAEKLARVADRIIKALGNTNALNTPTD